MPDYLFPLLAQKSSGFSRIFPDFLPENGYLKKFRGLQPPPPPHPHSPYAYACQDGKFHDKRWNSASRLAIIWKLLSSKQNCYTLLETVRHRSVVMPCRFTRTNAHAHQCCIFQSYAKTVPLRMKLTMREPASMTTDKGAWRMTSYSNSILTSTTTSLKWAPEHENILMPEI